MQPYILFFSTGSTVGIIGVLNVPEQLKFFLNNFPLKKLKENPAAFNHDDVTKAMYAMFSLKSRYKQTLDKMYKLLTDHNCRMIDILLKRRLDRNYEPITAIETKSRLCHLSNNTSCTLTRFWE